MRSISIQTVETTSDCANLSAQRWWFVFSLALLGIAGSIDTCWAQETPSVPQNQMCVRATFLTKTNDIISMGFDATDGSWYMYRFGHGTWRTRSSNANQEKYFLQGDHFRHNERVPRFLAEAFPQHVARYLVSNSLASLAPSSDGQLILTPSSPAVMSGTIVFEAGSGRATAVQLGQLVFALGDLVDIEKGFQITRVNRGTLANGAADNDATLLWHQASASCQLTDKSVAEILADAHRESAAIRFANAPTYEASQSAAPNATGVFAGSELPFVASTHPLLKIARWGGILIVVIGLALSLRKRFWGK
jgi:hypothetical protein